MQDPRTNDELAGLQQELVWMRTRLDELESRIVQLKEQPETGPAELIKPPAPPIAVVPPIETAKQEPEEVPESYCQMLCMTA